MLKKPTFAPSTSFLDALDAAHVAPKKETIKKTKAGKVEKDKKAMEEIKALAMKVKMDMDKEKAAKKEKSKKGKVLKEKTSNVVVEKKEKIVKEKKEAVKEKEKVAREKRETLFKEQKEEVFKLPMFQPKLPSEAERLAAQKKRAAEKAILNEKARKEGKKRVSSNVQIELPDYCSIPSWKNMRKIYSTRSIDKKTIEAFRYDYV